MLESAREHGRAWRGRGARIPRAVQYATKPAPNPYWTRELVHRLEARALARLEHGMENTTTNDLAEVRRDVASGMSVAAVAKKHNVPPSTLRGRLRKNGAAESQAHLAPNGAGVMEELENRYRALLSGVFRLAIKNKKATSNPMRDTDHYKEPDGRVSIPQSVLRP
ncbi:MAG TPA: hypothetical protein VI455_01705 [Terriglobia bacterium]